MNSVTSIQSGFAADRRTQTAAMKRWGGLVGGGALAIYGLSRRSPAGLALATKVVLDPWANGVAA
jgi:uncharacterized membrane protein